MAQQGDARAQYSLAVLYQKGQGLAKNDARALEWARRAADQDYKPGQILLQKLQAKTRAAAADVEAKPAEPKRQLTDLQRTEAAVGNLLRQISKRFADDGTLHYGGLQSRKLDDAIQVTIPDVVVRSSKGDLFELGEISAMVRHLDQRFDAITLALPGEIRFRSAAGLRGRATIAERLAKLRWDRELKISTEFEVRLGQLVFLDGAGAEKGRIGELLARADVTEADDLWSGPVRISLSKLNLTDGDQSGLQLESAAIVLNFQDLDLSAYAAYGTIPHKDKQAGGDGMPTLESMLTMASGIGLQVKIERLSVRNPDQGAFQLANADYGLELTSPDGKLLNFALTLRHTGLRGMGGAAPGAMMPQDLDIAMALENLPIATLANVGVTAAVEIALLGGVNSSAKQFNRLRRELSDATTVLRLKQVKVAARDYSIDMAMTLLADESAKAGFVGGGDLRIWGLTKLLSALGIQDLPALAELIKLGDPFDAGRGLLFALAMQPDGLLAVNGDPVMSLAPFQDKAE